MKPKCQLFIRRQQEMGRYPNNNAKPIVVANIVTPNMCVMIRAQKTEREQGGKNEDKDDSECNSTSNSSDNDTDSKDKNVDSSVAHSEEKLSNEGQIEEANEEDKQLGKDLIKETEWQKKKAKYTKR